MGGPRRCGTGGRAGAADETAGGEGVKAGAGAVAGVGGAGEAVGGAWEAETRLVQATALDAGSQDWQGFSGFAAPES